MNYNIMKELKIHFDTHYEKYGYYPNKFLFNHVEFNFNECVKLLKSVGYFWMDENPVESIK